MKDEDDFVFYFWDDIHHAWSRRIIGVAYRQSVTGAAGLVVVGTDYLSGSQAVL